ncbi:MAG: ATP-dependent Clp protease adaptor ClpS [Treponema sp.]|nr:ATP-dependent Clp protease adaptor ClpS [Treponema sp.]
MEWNENEGELLIQNDVQPPKDYKVILLNDDYTTKDFVVSVLESVFQKNRAESVIIMESVHKTGKGVAGIYTYDIAASKAEKTMKLARSNGFPLNCKLESCE